jgi:outer membrane protein TolC
MNPLLRRSALAVALASLLGGCASLSPRPDVAQVNRLLEERGAPVVGGMTADAPPIDVRDRLASPIDRDRAVAIALLRSPRMREAYARLGLARAEVIEAVEIANPGVSIARMNLSPGAGYNQTIGVSLPFVDALLLPVRARWARQQYERHGIEVAQAVIGLTVEVEAAWYRAVAAQQVADMRSAVAEGADATAELAQRFFDAGNISELQLKREQAVATQFRIDAAQARADALRERLAFGNLLGLSAADGEWSLADRLPMPVTAEDDAEALVRLAESSNLELQAARLQESQLRSALRTTRATRWFGGVEAGAEREKEADGAYLTGPTLSLELPLFNQGQGKLARAEALVAEAQARVQLAELNVTNAVRTGSRALNEHRQIVALHRDALIPQRERIVERSQQEQNFMLIGVFELVQAKVEEYDAYQSYLEAVRDYWLARVELMQAVGQRLPSDGAASPPTPSVQDILTPKGGMPGMDHGAMPGMDHSAHAPAAAEAAATPMDGMEGMEVMDHSQHGETAPPPESSMDGMDHSAHPPAAPEPAATPMDGMEGMEGMDHSAHGAPSTPLPPEDEADDALPESGKSEDDHHQHDHHDGGQGETP